MMQHSDQCFCPVKGIIDVISKKWALLIVNMLGNFTVLRFTELEKRLNGISPKTLSDTLSRLQQSGLVTRESFNEIPPRVEYKLTQDGEEFRTAIIPLIRWAAHREGWNSQHCPSNCDKHHEYNDDCYCTHKSTNPIRNTTRG
jgi:DNA-binding HxlR family transcriptional regulator